MANLTKSIMSITRINVFSVKKDDKEAIKAFQEPRDYFTLRNANDVNERIIERIDCDDNCTITKKEVFVDLPKKGRAIIGHIFRLNFSNGMPHGKSLLHYRRKFKDSSIYIFYQTDQYNYSPILIDSVDEKGFEWKATCFPDKYSIKNIKGAV